MNVSKNDFDFFCFEYIKIHLRHHSPLKTWKKKKNSTFPLFKQFLSITLGVRKSNESRPLSGSAISLTFIVLNHKVPKHVHEQDRRTVKSSFKTTIKIIVIYNKYDKRKLIYISVPEKRFMTLVLRNQSNYISKFQMNWNA